MHLKIPLHAKQREIFSLASSYKYVVFAKGRRFGFTHGALLYVIGSILGGKYKKVLWGDTTHGNNVRYIKRYALPLLNQVPKNLWKWNKNENVIEFYFPGYTAYIDFRSADKPENWEGFGYDLIILNEAGIILKNRYLWENAVRPMMLDNKNSKAIIGGAPKGKNLFYELYEKAQKDDTGRWIAKRYTSYDNPLIDPEEIKELEKELPEEAVKQEIYAEFIDSSGFVVVKHLKEVLTPQGDLNSVTIAIDPAYEGGDPAGIVIRVGDTITKALEVKANSKDELLREIMTTASPYLHKNLTFVIERDGVGQAIYEDMLKRYGELENIVVKGIKIGSRASKDIYKNKKAELWFKAREKTEKEEIVILQGLRELKKQLSRITYDVGEDGKISIIKKVEYRATYGGSPNLADAFVLAVQ